MNKQCENFSEFKLTIGEIIVEAKLLEEDGNYLYPCSIPDFIKQVVCVGFQVLKLSKEKSEIEENHPEMVGENQPEMDEKELRKQKRLDNKKLKKASFWRSVIFYVLFFVAFCLFSLFLFYVY